MNDLSPAGSLLPPNLDSAVRAELRQGERLVWAGTPRPWTFASTAIPIFLFGIVFLGFSVFWTASALFMTRAASSQGHGGPSFMSDFFPLFGIPFMLVGLGMLLSPVGYRIKASRTAYALTDRRALVFEGSILGGRTVRSYGPEQLGTMSRIERSSGAGSLVFEEVQSYVRTDNGPSVRTTRRGFLGIANVREVESLVRETLLVG